MDMIDNTYLGFPGLEHYDIKIKSYINNRSVNSITEQQITDLFKSNGNIVLSKNTVDINTGETDTITISDATGPVSVASSDSNIATAILNNDIITISGVNPGSVSVTVNVAATDTHYAVSKTINVIIEQSIQVITTIPSQRGNLTYNTNLQSPEWNDYNINQLALNGEENGTNAGTYTAAFTPKQGYCWEDETRTAKEVTWTIDKATGNITLSKNSIELSDDKESDTVTFSENTGDVSVTSADESIATANINGNVITIVKNNSLTLADLPDGAKVKAVGSKFYDKDLVFRKLGAGHSQDPADSVILQTNDIISLRCFDATEPNNSDPSRQIHGNNRYLYSNLLQWMNSDAGANVWYTAKHNADQKPNSANVLQYSGVAVNPYDTQAGFMNGFTADFKNSLLTVTKRTAKNTATDGGGYEDVESKFFLLSTTEVGFANENNIVEGSIYSLFNDSSKRIMVLTTECVNNSVGYTPTAGSAWYWWLRTHDSGRSDNVLCVSKDGTTFNGNFAYSGFCGLAPACAISKNQKVSKSVDSDGCYVLLYD